MTFLTCNLINLNMQYFSIAAVAILFTVICGSCRQPGDPSLTVQTLSTTYADTVFSQEYHDAYPVVRHAENLQVRSIAADDRGTVWICTPEGVFSRSNTSRDWIDALPAAWQGPAFSVVKDNAGAIWFSTWHAVYKVDDQGLHEMAGVVSPVSVLAASEDRIYALGPRGAWVYKSDIATPLNYTIARSVRAAAADGRDDLWVGSDVGYYYCAPDSIHHRVDTAALISAYVRGVDVDSRGDVWFGGLGGVSIRDREGRTRKLRPAHGIPSIQVNCVKRAPDGTMWVGTDVGIVRYTSKEEPSLLFSRRWLLDDRVLAITFDNEGTAWIGTDKGVSAIRRKRMTLASKERYFYDVLMRRHIREPWIAGQCRLPVAGDTTTWEPEDDDNDGEYTGNYLAMESFRYATTGSPDARDKARKAFGFLRQLQEITGTDGFFARTFVPPDWAYVHDGNRTYTSREMAEELVKEPRFKPVEVRWHRSADGKWLWKGDTSSDEICGHMFGYFFYYELVADEAEKKVVSAHVQRIVNHLMKNNYTLTDVDGKPTRWGMWSPDHLNRDPEWQPDRSLNSMELLAFLKFAYHVSADEKYQREYLRLIREEHYLENMANIPNQNPGWFIYFDVMLAAYQYPILLKCEKDPEILAFYEQHIDSWIQQRKNDANPLINFIYNYSRDRKTELDRSVDFLVDTPLDLIDWKIDHTKREDIRLVRQPVLDEIQVSALPPASIRSAVRWDKNPWSLNNGNPNLEREPVFWLLPYWMGRHLKMISE